MSEAALAGAGAGAPGTPLERLLRSARVPDHVARLLTATPSFRWSWLGAAAAAVAFAVGAASTGSRATLAFLVAAPLLPLGGVALAYGPWSDPMTDLSRAAPMSSARLLLIRAAAVLATCATGVGLAVAFVPAAELSAFAWILPSLGLTLATLALSTFLPVVVAAAAVTAGWMLAVVVSESTADVPYAAFRGPGQISFFVLAVGSSSVLAWRRERLEREGREGRRRLIDAAEQERRRIERNIHDGAQQQLVAISVKLGLVRTIVEKDPARAGELLEALRADAQEALEALREMTRGSCPPVLADAGLEAALTQKAAGATVPVVVQAGGLGRFPLHVETAVYFCCLEAVQNATKHARAGGVIVSLRRSASDLIFTVADDGAGFEPSAVRRGVGLRSLEERVEALGGTLVVRSSPGAGTTVTGRVPCARLG
jgi:signal transduction histidine kinase